MKKIHRVDLRHPDPYRDKGIIYIVDLGWWGTPIILPFLKAWIRLSELWENKNNHIWGKWKS